uniref:Uncharacterized protein n=1 Tax=Parascaris equorum TaxID=6256 RepID=A0A914S4M3_PAREQ
MIIAYTQVEDLYLHADNEALRLGRQDYDKFKSVFTEYSFNLENFFAHSGLQVILNAGINETVDITYTKALQDELSGGAIPIFSNNIENGFRIYVRNRQELAYASTEALTLSPSHRGYVALSLQKVPMFCL